MDTKYFSLEIRDNSKIVRIFLALLGISCLGVSVFWIIFNIRNGMGNTTLWITTTFLVVFGAYLVWQSLGYGKRYIAFEEHKIILRNNSFVKPVEMASANIEKIEVFPLKFIIHLKSSEKHLTRLGTSEIERIELLKDELVNFASENNITLEIQNEM